MKTEVKIVVDKHKILCNKGFNINYKERGFKMTYTKYTNIKQFEDSIEEINRKRLRQRYIDLLAGIVLGVMGCIVTICLMGI